MADKEYILTQQGKEELEQELDTLRNVTRAEISKKIEIARGFGDLSENAEYDAAKEEQAKVEARIQQLEYMMKHAKVVEDDGLDTVTVGKIVKLESVGDVPSGFEKIADMFSDEFSIVGSTEADPYKKRLSYESPVGGAILNHTEGETVAVELPAGTLNLKIVSVRR